MTRVKASAPSSASREKKATRVPRSNDDIAREGILRAHALIFATLGVRPDIAGEGIVDAHRLIFAILGVHPERTGPPRSIFYCHGFQIQTNTLAIPQLDAHAFLLLLRVSQ